MSEKEQKALKTVREYMWWSLGAGLLIPIPVLDRAVVFGVQLKMLAQLSKIYDISFDKSRGKAVIGSLIGFVVPHALSYGLIGSLIKTIPGIGPLAGAPAMAVFSAAYAWALGKVFIQHFESGGTFLDFDAEKVQEYFKTQFEEGRKLATTLNGQKNEESPA